MQYEAKLLYHTVTGSNCILHFTKSTSANNCDGDTCHLNTDNIKLARLRPSLNISIGSRTVLPILGIFELYEVSLTLSIPSTSAISRN